MSFNNELAQVKDDSLPKGMRYISLRHCVELYSPFGFNKTWEIMERKFGLKEGKENENEVFIKCAEFLEADRNAWKQVIEAQQQMAKIRAKYGLPKPKFHCVHKA